MNDFNWAFVEITLWTGLSWPLLKVLSSFIALQWKQCKAWSWCNIYLYLLLWYLPPVAGHGYLNLMFDCVTFFIVCVTLGVTEILIFQLTSCSNEKLTNYDYREQWEVKLSLYMYVHVHLPPPLFFCHIFVW